MVELDYTGVGITTRISSVQQYEANLRETTLEAANTRIRELMAEALRARYPGATIEVVTEGDAPSAEIANVHEYRIAQAMKYDIQRLGLKMKWDFSSGGLGLRPSYVGPIWG
jgi:hypothetical protein